MKGAFLGIELLFSPAEARCDAGPEPVRRSVIGDLLCPVLCVSLKYN